MPPMVMTDLDRQTREGDLFLPVEDNKLLCTACGHRCVLKPDQRGVCKVRYNQGGRLMVPFNYTGGWANDPIEKKPFFHVLPGSEAMSFGMLGCDFRCDYCQNWLTSQTLRDEKSTQRYFPATPEQICEVAVQHGSQSLISTYNEPLITSEWAVEVFKVARQRGLVTGYVSNGHGTPEVLEYIQPWVDLYKVDLKCFDDKKYKLLGGNFQEVLETIRGVKQMGLWTEIVTLVIPDYNDSDSELGQIAEFIASVSTEIPWHVTAFHPDYKMTDRGRTPVDTLQRARKLGQDAGLDFVYSGNRPGEVGDSENTFCTQCQKVLIARHGFRVMENAINDGACPDCATPVPGRWDRF